MTELEWSVLLNFIDDWACKYKRRDSAEWTCFIDDALSALDENDDFKIAIVKTSNCMRSRNDRLKYQKEKSPYGYGKSIITGECSICGKRLFRKDQKTCSPKCKQKKYRKKSNIL